MAVGGAALRLTSTLIRVVQFLASALILAVFAYFLAVFSNHNLPTKTWVRAVAGISGAGCLYTAFAILLTCCLGGVMFFAFLAIVLDIAFVGGFLAIAILTRGAATSNCNAATDTLFGANSGYGSNGFGFGNGRTVTYLPNPKQDCRLQKAAFAVSIVNTVLFIISAMLQLALGRRTQHDKRFGPSPANNYTKGSGLKWFGRKRAQGSRNKDMTGGVSPGQDYAGSAVPASSAVNVSTGAKPGYAEQAPATGAYGYSRPAHAQPNF